MNLDEKLKDLNPTAWQGNVLELTEEEKRDIAIAHYVKKYSFRQIAKALEKDGKVPGPQSIKWAIDHYLRQLGLEQLLKDAN